MEKKVEYKTDTLLDEIINFMDSTGIEIKLSSNATRRQYAPTATDLEWDQFKDTIEANGLDPRRKEVYFQKYESKEGKITVSIVTSYLIYSARAFRSGKIKSISAPKIIKPEQNIDSWIGEIEIERTDIEGKITWQTPMREVNKHQSIWNIMPEFMLKKNTFAQGLRFYLPDVIGGLPYLQEEITSGIAESDIIGNLEIPEEQKIEPDPEEQEAKDKIKNDFLDKLMNQLMEIKTIADLEKKYKTSKKSYESSEMKDSILSLFVSRKKQLTIEEIANKTGLAVYMVQTYIDESKSVSDGLISEILADNKDAILQFVEQATLFPAKNIASKTKEQSDSEEMMQEEMDLQEI